jgi:hypothetical protein
VTDPFVPPSESTPGPWSTTPWQQEDPYGGWQPPKRTNALAIASLVTGVLAIVPVAVGLALAAVRQVRRRDEEGVGLAAGGILASGLWTLLVALVAVIVIKGDFSFYDREGDLGDVASQEVGACLDKHPSQITDCSTPHDLEVFATGLLTEQLWPGTGAVNSDADELCNDAFEDYVGVATEESDYGYSFFAPSKREWAAGKRTVVCVITPADEQLVGSVKGTDG